MTKYFLQVILVRESPNFDEDNADSQEVLDDVICRQLTREYLDVVKAILTSGGGSDLVSVLNCLSETWMTRFLTTFRPGVNFAKFRS